MTTDFPEAIAAELRRALRRLGATDEELAGIDWKDNGAVTTAAQARGGSFELLCAIGSRGDTLSDEQVLLYLQAINQRGTIFRKAISEGE